MADLFLTRPVVVEAMRICGYTELLPPGPWNDGRGGVVWRWVHDSGGCVEAHQEDPGPAYGIVATGRGPMRARIGDWIVRDTRGDFYPVPPDVFDRTYEKAEKNG